MPRGFTEHLNRYNAAVREKSIARIREAVDALRQSGSLPVTKADVIRETGLSRSTVQRFWSDVLGEEGLVDSRRDTAYRKKVLLPKVREMDARIAEAVEKLSAAGEKVTYTRIAELVGCGVTAVTRRIRTDRSLKAVSRIDRNVSHAVASLIEDGCPVTAESVAAVTGYRPGIIKNRVARAVNAERVAA